MEEEEDVKEEEGVQHKENEAQTREWAEVTEQRAHKKMTQGRNCKKKSPAVIIEIVQLFTQEREKKTDIKEWLLCF